MEDFILRLPQNHNQLSSRHKGKKNKREEEVEMNAPFLRRELQINGIYKELVWPAIKGRPKATSVLFFVCVCVFVSLMSACMSWQSGRCWHDDTNTLHTFSALTLLGFTTWIEQRDFEESVSHKVSFNVGVCDITTWDEMSGWAGVMYCIFSLDVPSLERRQQGWTVIAG